DAMVGVSGMAKNTYVFLVQGVHGAPGERDASLQIAGVGGQASVLPRPPRGDMLLVRADAVPGRESEIGVLGRMLGAFQDIRSNVGFRKVGDRIAARLEQQKNILAFGDPTFSETHAPAPPPSLDLQKLLGQRFGYDELADWSG